MRKGLVTLTHIGRIGFCANAHDLFRLRHERKRLLLASDLPAD